MPALFLKTRQLKSWLACGFLTLLPALNEKPNLNIVYLAQREQTDAGESDLINWKLMANTCTQWLTTVHYLLGVVPVKCKLTVTQNSNTQLLKTLRIEFQFETVNLHLTGTVSGSHALSDKWLLYLLGVSGSPLTSIASKKLSDLEVFCMASRAAYLKFKL